MIREKKSKRQERRQQIVKKERRNRLVTIGLITIGAALVVFAVIYPYIRPMAEVVSANPGTLIMPVENTLGDPNAPIQIEEFADFQ